MNPWTTKPSADTDAAIHAREDQLMQQLANVQFERTETPAASEPVPAADTKPVPPLPVHAVEPDYQAVHAALTAGTIPTFADPADAPTVAPPLPLDAAAERAAFVAFLEFLNAHKVPGTTITTLDPDAYAKGLI